MKKNQVNLMLRFGCALWLISVMCSSVCAQETFVYDDHGKRDPMWPLVTPNGVVMNYDAKYDITDLNLEGIVSEQNGNSIAIVNGNVVRVGDVLGEYTIKVIENNMVILSKGSEDFKIFIKRED